MSKLRTAVVGLGDIGRYVAGFLRFDRHFCPQVVVDLDETRARDGARRFRFREWTTDYERVLTSPEVDAIYLAVPHHLHHSMLLKAIDAGKPVLCEKPITIRVDHALEVAQRAESAGVPVAVNYQYRFDRRADRLIRLVRAGACGNVIAVRCLVPWSRNPSYFSQSAWHASIESAGGGTLLTQASHVLDLALLAMDEQPVEAWGWNASHRFPDVEVEDTAFGALQFRNGAMLQVGSTMSAGVERGLSLEVIGDRGTISYRADTLAPLRIRGASIPRLPKSSRIPRGIHPLQRSMRAFRLWALGGEPSLHTASSAVPVLRAVQGCYASARNGSASVPLD